MTEACKRGFEHGRRAATYSLTLSQSCLILQVLATFDDEEPRREPFLLSMLPLSLASFANDGDGWETLFFPGEDLTQDLLTLKASRFYPTGDIAELLLGFAKGVEVTWDDLFDVVQENGRLIRE